MMDKLDIKWKMMSDVAILETVGAFIKYHRLEQNKSQSQLAEEAGINRSTLSEFEQGKRSNTITFIQLLRALNQLHALKLFRIQQELSPIQLAKLDQAKRKRAAKKQNTDKKPESDW